MRHAILGAGGVGSLIGGALARTGAAVVLVLRPETLARHRGRVRVESVVLGDFEVEVAITAAVDRAEKDFDAGRPLELDAIAGAVVRGGRRHGVQTPVTEELVRLIEGRRAAAAQTASACAAAAQTASAQSP